jgi:hypothetical protein
MPKLRLEQRHAACSLPHLRLNSASTYVPQRIVPVNEPTAAQAIRPNGSAQPPTRMLFVSANPEQFALVSALSRAKKGWYMVPVAPGQPLPIITQQALAIVLQPTGENLGHRTYGRSLRS